MVLFSRFSISLFISQTYTNEQLFEHSQVQKPANLSNIIFLASNLFMHIFNMFVAYL